MKLRFIVAPLLLIFPLNSTFDLRTATCDLRLSTCELRTATYDPVTSPAGGTRKKRKLKKHPKPATKGEHVNDSDIFARILQREDSRWMGADNFLAEQTQSSNTAVKMRALLALGRIGDPRALPLLFERLSDLNPLVRARALFAAGQIVDISNRQHEGFELRKEWLSPIVSSLSDPDPLVRLRAIEALGKSADKAYTGRLATAILENSENGDIAGQGLMALVRIGDPASLDTVLALRNHNSAEVRWRLASAVYRLRNAAAAEKLAPLLEDNNSQVRAQSARAYGLIGERAVPALVPLLRDSNLAVRIEAARGLALTRSPLAAQSLADFIAQRLPSLPGQDEQAIAAAAESWGNMKSNAGVEVLLRLARDRRPASAQAIVALAKLRKGDETFPAEIEIVGDPFWLQRFKVQALGENGSQAAMQKLLSIVAYAAASSERKLLLPWSLDAIIQTERQIQPEAFWRFLPDPDPILRAHAIEALATLNRRSPGNNWSGEAAQRVMRSYFKYQAEQTTDARLATTDFLATLDAATAVPLLESVCRDMDRNVRLKARNLLGSRFHRSAPAIAGLVNTGRNYNFYVAALDTIKRYSGARFSTDRGEWTIKFFESDAPLTVFNFIHLARQGYLNNLTFPRVVPDFVIQGGDPRNDTDGGPGYAIRCEINEHSFVRGAVGMALSGKDTGGSQYFICHSPQPHLDGEYTAFAQVEEGVSVLDRVLLGDRVRSITLLPQSGRQGGTEENPGGSAAAAASKISPKAKPKRSSGRSRR
ncbi:MAG TPA: HEAT repeat domain-containing protein [Acidobacteriota bacterium]|jgi:cyclophilin family peptidyl-prolyl cis-trans isomerase/HEAT repeat protein